MPGIAPRPLPRSSFALLATLLAALATHAALAAGPGPQAGRDPAGLIAFVDESGHVAVVDPDTAEVTAFGASDRQAVFPAWSSDGGKVAAVVAGPGGTRVELVDVARGGEPVVVLAAADRGPIYLFWSPDDRYLTVLSSAAGGTLALDALEVEGAAAGGPDARLTLATGQPLYWDWSPTGRAVLVHVDVLRPSALVGMGPVDSFTVDEPLPDPGAFQSPDISDSGDYLAYASRDASGSRVVVTGNPERGAGNEAVAQLAHEGMVAFAWRPGHEQLSVQGATTPGLFTGPVELLDVPSGESRVIRATNVIASFWSPDAPWLATLSRDEGEERVAQAGPALSHVQDRVQGRTPVLNLEFFDVDNGADVAAGALQPTPAFVAQYLPFFDQYSRSHSLWAPDSSALVLPTVDPEGTATLVIFGVDGTSQELVGGDMPAWNVR